MRNALVLILFAACTPPVNTMPRPTREVRVVLEDGTDMTGWWQWHRKALLKLWPRLDGTGYRFVLDARNPDVRIRTYDAGPLCSHGGGYYEPGRPFVLVDPACAHTAEELRYLVGHEVLHWLTWRDFQWAGHLCVHDTDAPDCHPRVRGTGMLSPFMADSLEEETIRSVNAWLTPSDLALLEALRAR